MSHISKDTKMCDLVFCSAQMPGLLYRFGLGFGFGEQTVEEVCAQHAVSTRLFLATAGLYLHETGKWPAEAFTRDETAQAVAFLRQSHACYHLYFFPKVHRLLHRVLAGCSADEAGTINKFFDAFEEQLFRHFELEERQVLPRIDRWLDCPEAVPDIPEAASFGDTHDQMESELSDLRSILVKYLGHTDDEFSRMELLGTIHTIGMDLHCHSLMEEQLLKPFAVKAERHA